MSDRPSRMSPAPRRWLGLLTTIALLSTLLAVNPTTAAVATAATAVAFDNTFTDSTVDGTGTVTTPTSATGTNHACLTASGNTSTGPLLSCSGTTDAEGSGALQLTESGGYQLGAVFGSTSFSTAHGLDVSFNSYQYGGNGADGIGFVLAADDPDSPAPPTATGPAGGALGYAPSGTPGVEDGYLGVGLDVYGNYSLSSVSGSGCTNPSTISGFAPGAVVVRGPGSGTTGYCGLTTTYDGTSASQLTLRADSRAASLVPVRVLVNPTGSSLTTSDGVTVPSESYRVIVTPVGGTPKTQTGDLPAVPAGLYPSDDWLDAHGVPKQLSFGWFGSTGGLTDVHEISDAQVRTLDPEAPDAPARPSVVAGLRQATLSWAAPSGNGAPIASYVITPYL
ncbi:MAG: lectin-like domain-containing protein, partial [Janthinobacterium lividum]